MVIGGTLHPLRSAPTGCTSVWDQNTGLRALARPRLPSRRSGRWVLELLGLPPSAVGFVTGR